MPRQLPDSKTLILKVIKTFQTEANRNKPIAGFSNPLKRAALTLDTKAYQESELIE